MKTSNIFLLFFILLFDFLALISLFRAIYYTKKNGNFIKRKIGEFPEVEHIFKVYNCLFSKVVVIGKDGDINIAIMFPKWNIDL